MCVLRNRNTGSGVILPFCLQPRNLVILASINEMYSQYYYF